MKTMIATCGAALLVSACAYDGDASYRVSDREVLADGVICETFQPTGTRVGTKRLCTTEEDRAQMKADADRLFRNIDDNRVVRTRPQ